MLNKDPIEVVVDACKDSGCLDILYDVFKDLSSRPYELFEFLNPIRKASFNSHKHLENKKKDYLKFLRLYVANYFDPDEIQETSKDVVCTWISRDRELSIKINLKGIYFVNPCMFDSPYYEESLNEAWDWLVGDI